MDKFYNMTDLNELSQFEKDLKNLIESRNTFQPTYASGSSQKSNSSMTCAIESEADKLYNECNMTLMGAIEHGQPYNMMTRMGTIEHGQPYNMMTRLPVSEHGKPYPKQSSMLSRMAIREHGQPYESPRIPTNRQRITPSISTNMAVKEHRQSYKPNCVQTKMATNEHGKPFKLFGIF